jgi:hypothetical protein
MEAPKEQEKKNQELKKIVEENAFKEKVPLGPRAFDKFLTKFLSK